MTYRSNLEAEIAMLVVHLRAARMTLRQSAIHYNCLLRNPPRHSLESRIDSLAAEIAYLRKALT